MRSTLRIRIKPRNLYQGVWVGLRLARLVAPAHGDDDAGASMMLIDVVTNLALPMSMASPWWPCRSASGAALLRHEEVVGGE